MKVILLSIMYYFNDFCLVIIKYFEFMFYLRRVFFIIYKRWIVVKNFWDWFYKVRIN